METAIKIAIENGWNPFKTVAIKDTSRFQKMDWETWGYYNQEDRFEGSVNEYRICLDPLFWQCLGKGLGWGRDEAKIKELKFSLEYEESMYNSGLEYPTDTPQFYDAQQRTHDKIRGMRQKLYEMENGQTWKQEWHRFIDHLSEGKDIESFFTNL